MAGPLPWRRCRARRSGKASGDRRGSRAYGISLDELEDYYRDRTVLKINVLREAVVFCAPDARSSKSTGNILNVGRGISAAYTQ